MAKRIFISYNHKQSHWVKERLVPCLEAGGAELLIDYRKFGAGRTVIGQMDATQDKADINLLVLSPGYLVSKYCRHEMNRAIDRDPNFEKGMVLPVKKEKCILPMRLRPQSQPLYVNLQNDKDAAQWDLLMKACSADLGVAIPDWLSARDDICKYLKRNDSVNLVIQGKHIKWRELLIHIRDDYFNDLGMVDLESGATASRRGLVTNILKASGVTTNVPEEPDDLVALHEVLSKRPQKTKLIIKHFDQVVFRPYYDHNLFSTLRYLLMESQKLVLLIHSRKSFVELVPPDNPLSSITNMKTVELRGTL